MSLEVYKQKRSFKKTPEPTGGKSKAKALVFVVQKHQASHLHYDFRLEIKGALKSWAVPKGPSMNPEERRLAQLVEDHPFDYKDFEGIIPEGNYGAGTVIIWDEGTYMPEESTGKKDEDEKLLIKQFYAGKMSIVLKGKKLKGKFNLIKTPARGGNAWLLSKSDDKYATEKNIADKDASVVSGLTIEEMTGNADAAKWKSNRSSATKARITNTKTKTEEIIIAPAKRKNYKQVVEFIKRDFKKAGKTEMPTNLEPMLATLIDEPFDGEDWIFEIKWDGYRSISYVNKGNVNVRSRSNLPFNKNYPPVVAALESWGINVVVDGEIVVLNEEGKTEFNALQNWATKREGNLFYYLFDILWLDGIDLTHEPLYKRKEILQKLIPEGTIIRYSDGIEEQGVQFFQVAKENGLEGIVGKRKNSLYIPGDRNRDWVKLPVEEIKEYIIVGYTESEANRPFSRIMFGEYRDGELYYIHHSGGGISDELLHDTYKRLKKLELKKKPVANEAKEETPIHWVKPILIGRFKEKSLKQTPSGRKRHPVIFLGIREDIEPEEITDTKNPKPVKLKKSSKNFDQAEVWKKIHHKEIQLKEQIDVEGKKLTLINIGKPYWTSISKAEVMSYYGSIHQHLLPYLKDRPLGLRVVRDWAGEEEDMTKPNFIRNMKGLYPSWVNTFTTDRKNPVEGKSEDIDWVVCNDLATLMYLLNLDAVDFHPWSSRIHSFEYPDYIVIDLDPYEKQGKKDKVYNQKMFLKMIEVAQAAKEIFDKLGLHSFVKTSGKKGMHLLLPCKGIKYGNTRPIAETLCEKIHKAVPKISTVNQGNHGREDKIYIDPSQNDYGDRLVAPYCVRAYQQPYISTPLNWSEVNKKLDKHAFTIYTIQDRLEQVGDPFEGLFESKYQKNNSAILKQLLD
jgi:bifunctional non-homologous end joining protein LigD